MGWWFRPTLIPVVEPEPPHLIFPRRKRRAEEEELDIPSTGPVADAFVRKLEAESAAFLAAARKDNAEATYSEVEAEKAEWALADLKAHDIYNFVYRFEGEVGEKSVDACISRLNVWRRRNPEQAITIIFSSPGGSVVPGMALYDYLTELRASGHHLTTVAQGMAASMAGILLQAGDRRVIGPESWVLIHQVQASAMGSWGDLQDRMKWLEKVQDRILDIFARRAAETTGKSFSSTRKTFATNWQRTDWWLSSDECVALGVADEIGR